MNLKNIHQYPTGYIQNLSKAKLKTLKYSNLKIHT